MIQLYTDGAAKGNPGPGGYGSILIYGDQYKELHGAYARTTNNRMELMAVIVGLEAVKKQQTITVYTDSRYVVDSVQKGWLWQWVQQGFKKRKNSDLWRRFITVYKKHHVRFEWIKGHAGHPLNERCDTLAVMAADKGPWEVDAVYERKQSIF